MGNYDIRLMNGLLEHYFEINEWRYLDGDNREFSTNYLAKHIFGKLEQFECDSNYLCYARVVAEPEIGDGPFYIYEYIYNVDEQEYIDEIENDKIKRRVLHAIQKIEFYESFKSKYPYKIWDRETGKFYNLCDDMD